MNEIERRTLIGAAGIGALAALSKGGPLDPPGGPVSPSGRTLDDIYNRIPVASAFDGRTPIAGGTAPVTISSPGSYVLTGNLTVTATNPIIIAAGNVDLDLNGYTVTSTSGFTAIANVGGRAVRIRNGRVAEGFYGINCGPTHAVTIEDVHIDRCRFSGIHASSSNRGIVVRRCNITETGATSLPTDTGSTIRGVYLTGVGNSVIDTTVHRILATFTPALLRGIEFAGSFNTAKGCLITSDSATLATGILFTGSGLYRDNSVQAMSIPYNGGTNGGGNT